MGLSNRDYFQDDEYGGGGFQGGPRGPMNATTLVTAAIAIGYVLTTLMGRGGEIFRLSESAVRSGYVWQLITYGFSAEPNGVNVIWVFLFIAFFFYSISARMVEPLIGKAEYLWLFLCSILAGGVIGAFVPQNSFENYAGPLVGPHAMIVWAALKYPRHIIHLLGIIPIPLWAIGAVDVLFGIWPTIQGTGQGVFVMQPVVAAFIVAGTHQYYGWRFTALRESLARLKPKPKLKVYAPDETPSKEDQLSEQVDAILEKISREGEASLSSKERRILKQASKQYKDRV